MAVKLFRPVIILFVRRNSKTNFEIRSQVSRRLVPAGGEISPQLLNGGHRSSGDTIQTLFSKTYSFF